MSKTQEIEIKLITIGQEMQQRGGINDDTVAQYAEAMQAGDTFPPAEAVSDGEFYWLFDGFHRIKAAQKAGLKTIMVNIRQGTKRDAEYLSFSANARHGLPRPRGSLKRILVKILTDPEWSKISLRAISRHVGCDERYVRITMEEQSADSPQLDRAERIEVKTSDGRNYTLPAERKDRPAKTTNELTGIITQLTEIDTNKAAKKELSAAVKHIETAKTLINKDLSQ
jgi:ParB-like chromosome segregation protein Spo0J